ncbi:MAG TPA: tetratricopeptide repeat protein [Allosphingosinicella sp.]|nr:tetratricopeptide repeat protein [Allosphingosinicella sp.]
MGLGKLFLTATFATFAIPAAAAIFTVGSNSARLCYEAADSGRFSAAGATYCDRALSEDALSSRDTVATHVNRGIIRFFKGDLAAALSDFDEAIARDPREAEAYLNKGVVLLRQPGGVSEAVPLFTTAIEKRTKKPALAYLGRGMAYELSGNVNAAYRDYKQASLLAPDWSAPAAELGRFQVVGN